MIQEAHKYSDGTRVTVNVQDDDATDGKNRRERLSGILKDSQSDSPYIVDIYGLRHYLADSNVTLYTPEADLM